MGFRTPWGTDPLSDLNWKALTHVIQVGVEPQTNGGLIYSDTLFNTKARDLIATAHQNHVKVLLNVWSAPGSDFTNAITLHLPVLVNNILGVVASYGYDGVDLDWEAGFNPTAMGSLLSALRSALGTGLLLTADACVGTEDALYWASLNHYLDRVNVMTYDLGGFWDPYSWFNSALYGPSDNSVWSVQLAVARFLAAGTPAAKLNIGIPFYGYSYVGGGITGPRQAYGNPFPTRSQIKYQDIIANYAASPVTFDGTAGQPWLAIANGWVTFDNPQSVQEKVAYARSNQLGGVFIWALDKDWLPNQTPRHPLLAAVQQALQRRIR
jgi:chitinase